MKTSAIAIGIALFAAGAFAGESPVVTFTQAPSAKSVGNNTVISFAASEETDVAVYIMDATGKVVRHLVAGVLGKNPPAPLKPGLAQSIEWDGKDDNGKPATGGPFRARVAVGLKPTFDSFMLYNPDAIPRVHALAAGPGGEVFGTHLSKAGVAPRVAQAAMRNSSLDLTMNVYTDPQLLDVAGALEKLPELEVDGGSHEVHGAANLRPTIIAQNGSGSP